MLSTIDIDRVASALLDRMGEVAVAAAMLRAQQAHAKRRYNASAEWYQIAEAALSRLSAEAESRSAAGTATPQRGERHSRAGTTIASARARAYLEAARNHGAGHAIAMRSPGR